MRNKIFGGIGILWGGSIVIRWFMSDTPSSGNSAYQAGYSAAVIFGLILFLVGLYYFFKKSD